jgi:hypothetical protein
MKFPIPILISVMALAAACHGNVEQEQPAGHLCDSDAECASRDVARVCERRSCFEGACVTQPAPLATPCEDGHPWMVCDGKGTCAEVFEYGGACYTVEPFDAQCPSCDDGDPCTADTCVELSDGHVCKHEPLAEGYTCGPWMVCQSGVCCPHPDTKR